MIQAKVIADSKSPQGKRLTTMVVTFPRFILAELNTHRMFSRNSASSRAIPFEKMVKSVQENPFIPIAWQKDHKGMQGSEYFNHNDTFIELEEEKNCIRECFIRWNEAKNYAIKYAKKLNKLQTTIGEIGVTKQLCNRLLEPFMWHTVIISATEWENFFALRCPQYQTPVSQTIEPQRSWKDLISNHSNLQNLDLLESNRDNWIFKLQHNKGQAEIHMMALAEAMWDAYNESVPKQLKAGEWHIPFGDDINVDKLEEILHGPHRASYIRHDGDIQQAKVEIATAMCARVSYTVVGEEGKEPNYENDLKLHDRLAKSGHWSPFEHCAKVMDDSEYVNCIGTNYNPITDVAKTIHGISGNFQGFIQYRKMFNNENITA